VLIIFYIYNGSPPLRLRRRPGGCAGGCRDRFGGGELRRGDVGRGAVPGVRDGQLGFALGGVLQRGEVAKQPGVVDGGPAGGVRLPQEHDGEAGRQHAQRRQHPQQVRRQRRRPHQPKRRLLQVTNY